MKIIIYSVNYDERIYYRVKPRVLSFGKTYLNAFLYDKDYGADVKEIALQISFVEEEVKSFTHIYRPKYYDFYTQPKSNICLSAIPETYIKRFWIDSKISPEVFRELLTASDEEIDAIIARHFYKSLDKLDLLPKRLKHFDKEGFKRDVENLFKSHGWL